MSKQTLHNKHEGMQHRPHQSGANTACMLHKRQTHEGCAMPVRGDPYLNSHPPVCSNTGTKGGKGSQDQLPGCEHPHQRDAAHSGNAVSNTRLGGNGRARVRLACTGSDKEADAGRGTAGRRARPPGLNGPEAKGEYTRTLPRILPDARPTWLAHH